MHSWKFLTTDWDEVRVFGGGRLALVCAPIIAYDHPELIVGSSRDHQGAPKDRSRRATGTRFARR